MIILGNSTVDIDTWAQYWGIPHAAVSDLKHKMSTVETPTSGSSELSSEAGVTKAVRVHAARNGWLLWRNNIGAMEDPRTGRVIRYGLANESRQMNQVIKSSDLIGIRPVLITNSMVGRTIGQFVAIEVKNPAWKYTHTDREKAQLKYIELILSKGGFAKFANSLINME